MFNVIIVLPVFYNLCNAFSLLNNTSLFDHTIALATGDSDYIYDYVNASRVPGFREKANTYIEEVLRMCSSMQFCSSEQVSRNDLQVASQHISDASTSVPSTTYLVSSYFWSGSTTATPLHPENVDLYDKKVLTDGNLQKAMPQLRWILPPSTSQSEISAHRSCCQQCSCSPDCFLSYNCCPDVQLDYDHIDFSLSYCLSAYIKFGPDRFNTTEVDQTTWPSLEYLIADGCPEDPYDCSYIFDYFNVTFDDIVLVSTKDKVYINKQCAACDGETNVRRWNLMATDCEEDLYTLSLIGSDLTEYVLQKCTVYSVPPEHVDADPFVCYYQDAVSTCNVTGLWEVYDELLIDLCQSDDYYAFDEEGTTFTNIFCLLCNKPVGYVMPEMCTDRKTNKVPTRGPAYRLLYDWEHYSTAIDSADDNFGAVICSNNMLYDPHLDYCRELLCPFQGFAHNGQCYTHREFVAINRYFEVGFRVHLLESLKKVQQFTTLMFKQFLGNVFGNISIGSMCEIGDTLLAVNGSHGNTDVSDIILILNLKSSTSCNEDLIKRLVTHDYVTENNTRIEIDNERIDVTVEPLTNPEFVRDDDSRQITTLYQLKSRCTDCYVADIGRLFCPYFKLNRSEYCALYEKHFRGLMTDCPIIPFDSKIILDVNGGNGMTQNLYYVCADDYKQLVVKQTRNQLTRNQYQSGAAYLTAAFLADILLVLWFRLII